MTDMPVFVVSASEAERKRVGATVAELGYTPLLLASAEECLEAMEENDPLAVLMDLWLSPTRGDECCKKIKETLMWRSTPVILMTNDRQPHEVMFCWRAAADDFVARPITAQRLARKLAVLSRAQTAVPSSEPAVQSSPLLLADSSRFFRNQLGGNLQHAGFQLLNAGDGDEALALAQQHAGSIEACIIDAALPGRFNGLQVLEALKQMPALASKRTVVLARDLTPSLRASVRELTGTEPLSKRDLPFEVILAHVQRVLRPHSSELRASERMPFFSLVEFSIEDEWASGFTYDISSGGLFVRTLTPPPPLSEVSLRIWFAGQDEPSESRGIVAWSNPFHPRGSFTSPLGMGVRVTEMAPQLRQQVGKLIDRPTLKAG